MLLQEQVATLADMLLNSKKTVVLTGAGISTESGIPDFRSPGGLWSKVDPMYAFSAETFTHRPEAFYQAGLPHLASIKSARPNRAHEVLAELEKASLLAGVVTQNVDSLHQRAGSTKVWEVHGHLRSATCMQCGGQIVWDHLMDKVMASQIPPRCNDCQGIYKPDCVFFGDPLTRDFTEATREVATTELMLVIGSSLEVAPANYLPMMAGSLAIINLDATVADSKANLIINRRAGETMDLLWNVLLRRHLV
ncbi:SIR2 family NAD-dependent protein deacylase [Desulfoscipio gibsoniae]|uniref:protein acetyllysine N-acetyltransferase n=1 Tax=Desulfoscipio gibsoniae DSM 7213 TaxID=767817 RepID=R4KBN4_9FIRM|nr:Sir2 family NAD-dependent protein deacetylase [Desulfoscipio gibsoniae]AGK99988.1 NAD-dependent protein deacetylase, SIR2 family [Desulfoscipio gibsoniae DSM 7213]